MKKKKVFLGITLVTIIFLTTGCFKKKVITTEEFKNKAENSGYITINVKNQYMNDLRIKEATVAQKEDYQVEFYVLDDNSNAKIIFSNTKEDFQKDKDKVSVETTKNMLNYSTYSLKTGGYYMYLSRVQNTLLYVKVKEKYQDSVKELIKELDY